MKSVLPLVVTMLVFVGCATQRGFPPQHGIGNFDRFDQKVYRGAQPNQDGIHYLKRIGVVMIINLRLASDSAPFEPVVAKQVGILYTNIPLNGMSAPSRAQIELIMRVMEAAPGPVFIHCQWGCDRTGTACAVWRIQHGWSNSAALQEAVVYGMSSFEVGMKNFIRHYRK